MATQALHKQEDTDRIERKLEQGAQILPLGPPLLANDEAMLARLQHALADTDPKEKSDTLDRLYHAALGQVTNGFSPAALTLAYVDWLMHLANSPYRRLELLHDAQRRMVELYVKAWSYLSGDEKACCPQDERFELRYKDESWRRWPYNMFAQTYLAAEDWWCEASHIRGMTKHHQRMVAFLNMLALSALAPENHPLTNPEMRTQQHGLNYFQGFSNALDDFQRWWTGGAPAGSEEFKPGKNVAM